MLRHLVFLTGATALLLTACTQPPAQVVYKGNQFYGKSYDGIANNAQSKPKSYVSSMAWNSGESSYSEPAHYDTTTSTVAPATSVGVSELKPIRATDLPPPAKTESFKPAPLPQSSLQPVAPKALQEQMASFIWPVEGRVTQRFGKKDSGVFNDGIDIAADEGEPIWAAQDGEVIYAGDALKGYGNMAIVRHKDDWITSYAHASRLSVKKGDKVRQGELIGYVGTSGGISQPQLQFAVRKGKTPVNPELYLSRNVASR